MTLKQWMHEYRWTAEQIADKLGVSRQAVYGWLAGDFRPSAANLAKLDILTKGAVSPRWFFDQRGASNA